MAPELLIPPLVQLESTRQKPAEMLEVALRTWGAHLWSAISSLVELPTRKSV